MRAFTDYVEHAPAPRLSRHIECFWTVRAIEDEPSHAVMPDGCADIIFTQGAAPADLRLVGPMTSVRHFAIPRGQTLFGARFRPAMWGAFLKAPWPDLTDGWAALEARPLLHRLEDSLSLQEKIAATETWLGTPRECTLVQCMAEYACARQGRVRVDELGLAAGLSPRQLRRLFLAEIGLTPKQLCRILRFRFSLQQLSQRTDCAQVALQCGYYDQPHFINEFRSFSGYTPLEYPARAR